MLLNATAGVPLKYLVPPFLEGEAKAACYSTYALRTHIPVQCADKIVSLVRHYATQDVYVTGQIVETKVDISVKWQIVRFYRRLLAKATKNFDITKVILLDQSFRVKRIRSLTKVTDAFGTTRSLVWYETMSCVLGDHVGSWFDISLSQTPVRLPFETEDDLNTKASHIRHIIGRVCGACGKQNNPIQENKLPQCAKCRIIYYCSKVCQVNHWPEHKKTCKKRA
jgi:hypothetical protein